MFHFCSDAWPAVVPVKQMPLTAGLSIQAFKSHSTWRLVAWTAYAFFDDGGGGNPADADFDDMVVRITAVERAIGQVPIPGALILFASGLLGLTALGRRRMRPLSASGILTPATSAFDYPMQRRIGISENDPARVDTLSARVLH